MEEENGTKGGGTCRRTGVAGAGGGSGAGGGEGGLGAVEVFRDGGGGGGPPLFAAGDACRPANGDGIAP